MTGAVARLLRFNRDLLAQGRRIALAHRAAGMPPFGRPAGAHLRHVIEHYDALALGVASGVVDYDARRRDPALENDPVLACDRIDGLARAFSNWRAPVLAVAVEVRGKAGVGGDFDFALGSTIGRELVFVASHAVHHFALLADYCARHGIDLGPGFGKAPATIAHERSTYSPRRKESRCSATTAS